MTKKKKIASLFDFFIFFAIPSSDSRSKKEIQIMNPSIILRSSTIPTLKKTIRSDLPSILNKARIRCGIPGMSVAVMHQKTLIFAEGFGIRNEQQEPFTVEVEEQLQASPNPGFSLCNDFLADDANYFLLCLKNRLCHRSRL